MANGTTNTFRPTALSFNSYGWRGAPMYNSADSPQRGPTPVDRRIAEQQFAYEWLDSSSALNGSSNPPFTTGAAGRLLPGAGNNKVLRGFIRRAEYDNSDPTSKARLYFMFNPETITRQYVSYLDQGAIDPFNTIYQSGNLVAPPSYMDFNFSLLFDRQEETSNDASWPGVFVDYEYFDLVVRNVVPSGPTATSNTLPDNGVMMVNPRDITVVFSPNLTVQGRPSNAQVTFTKFTHRMVPVRMQIDLTLRVVYFGPMKDMIEYVSVIDTTANTVPWKEVEHLDVKITNDDINKWKQDQKTWASGITDAISKFLDKDDSSNLSDQAGVTGGGSADLNSQIVDFGAQQAQGAGARYDNGGGRGHLWTTCDCSSFVWGSFAYFSGGSKSGQMGWPAPSPNGPASSSPNSSPDMLAKCRQGKSVQKIFDSDKGTSRTVRLTQMSGSVHQMQKGDLLFRENGLSDTSGSHGSGHVAFISKVDSQKVYVIDAASPSIPVAKERSFDIMYLYSDYNACYRPMLVGSGMQINNSTPVGGGTDKLGNGGSW